MTEITEINEVTQTSKANEVNVVDEVTEATLRLPEVSSLTPWDINAAKGSEVTTDETMIINMGPISKVMGMLPGFTSEMFQGTEKEASQRLRAFMTIMDSMNNGELDSDGKCFNIQPNRVTRVSRGSGCNPTQVSELLEQYKTFASFIKKMGGSKGLLSSLGGDMNQRMNPNQMAKMQQQLSRVMDPNMFKQMGGLGGLQDIMRQFGMGGNK
jgi:signal recognition particle subunit SRP54